MEIILSSVAIELNFFYPFCSLRLGKLFLCVHENLLLKRLRRAKTAPDQVIFKFTFSTY